MAYKGRYRESAAESLVEFAAWIVGIVVGSTILILIGTACVKLIIWAVR